MIKGGKLILVSRQHLNHFSPEEATRLFPATQAAPGGITRLQHAGRCAAHRYRVSIPSHRSPSHRETPSYTEPWREERAASTASCSPGAPSDTGRAPWPRHEFMSVEMRCCSPKQFSTISGEEDPCSCWLPSSFPPPPRFHTIPPALEQVTEQSDAAGPSLARCREKGSGTGQAAVLFGMGQEQQLAYPAALTELPFKGVK